MKHMMDTLLLLLLLAVANINMVAGLQARFYNTYVVSSKHPSLLSSSSSSSNNRNDGYIDSTISRYEVSHDLNTQKHEIESTLSPYRSSGSIQRVDETSRCNIIISKEDTNLDYRYPVGCKRISRTANTIIGGWC